jgi:hypothetical protein
MFEIFNYKIHPKNKEYILFFFDSHSKAEYYKEKLIINAISFEYDDESAKEGKHIFAIHKNDFERARDLSFEVQKKYKSPFIGDELTRKAILIFVIIVAIFAVVSYFMNQS